MTKDVPHVITLDLIREMRSEGLFLEAEKLKEDYYNDKEQTAQQIKREQTLTRWRIQNKKAWSKKKNGKTGV